MSTPFGPQLIGETEKTLNAILRRVLRGTGLTEPHWVTLRLASQLGAASVDELGAAVADRAHYTDAAQLVHELTERGLLHTGQLTAAGRELLQRVQDEIARTTAPIWSELAPDDVAATERLLNEIVQRARRVLTVDSAAA